MIKVNKKEINMTCFPNGELKFEKLYSSILKEKNKIYFKYENESDLISLFLLKKHFDTLEPNLSYELDIAYMPYERMDRVSDKSEVFTLKYISDFINSMNFKEVKVLEPHSDVSIALLNRSTGINVSYVLTQIVLRDILKLKNDEVVICYPDAGAQKRYSDFEKSGFTETLVGYKKREWETGKILSLELLGSNVKDKTVVIVDDLSSFGGTFILTAKKLKEQGAKKVILVVTHAEENMLKGEIFKTDLIDEVYCTDSIITKTKTTESIRKLHIFSAEEVFQND